MTVLLEFIDQFFDNIVVVLLGYIGQSFDYAITVLGYVDQCFDTNMTVLFQYAIISFDSYNCSKSIVPFSSHF